MELVRLQPRMPSEGQRASAKGLGDLTERHFIAISEGQTDEPSVYWIDCQAVIDGKELESTSSGTFDDAKLRMWSQLGQPSRVPEIPLRVHASYSGSLIVVIFPAMAIENWDKVRKGGGSVAMIFKGICISQ